MYPDAAQHTPMLQGWESGTGKGPEMSIDLISSFISRIGNFSFLNKNPVFEDRNRRKKKTFGIPNEKKFV